MLAKPKEGLPSVEHRVGIIGAGDVVQRFYLPTLAKRPHIKLVAICSSDGRSAAALAESRDIPFVARNYVELIARPDVDTVVVCTPPYTHREIAGHALQAGKHALVEKPVCAAYEDFCALLEEAHRAPSVFSYTFNNRLREENQWLIRQVLAGRIGVLELVDAEWLRTKPRPDKAWWRDPRLAGGGVMADLGSHLLMICLDLIADRETFAATCTQVCHEDGCAVEDIAVAQVTVNGRFPVHLRLGWGMAIAEAARVNICAYGAAGRVSNRDYAESKSDGYGHVIDGFLACIEEGRRPDLALLDDAMRLLDALYRAAREGITVTGRFAGAA